MVKHPGSPTALQTLLETTFHQQLDRDGHVGWVGDSAFSYRVWSLTSWVPILTLVVTEHQFVGRGPEANPHHPPFRDEESGAQRSALRCPRSRSVQEEE